MRIIDLPVPERANLAEALIDKGKKNTIKGMIEIGFGLLALRKDKAWRAIIDGSWQDFLRYKGFVNSKGQVNRVFPNRCLWMAEFLLRYEIPAKELEKIAGASRIYDEKAGLRALETKGILNKENVAEWIQKAQRLPGPYWQEEVIEAKGETCEHTETKYILQITKVCKCGSAWQVLRKELTQTQYENFLQKTLRGKGLGEEN